MKGTFFQTQSTNFLVVGFTATNNHWTNVFDLFSSSRVANMYREKLSSLAQKAQKQNGTQVKNKYTIIFCHFSSQNFHI